MYKPTTFHHRVLLHGSVDQAGEHWLQKLVGQHRVGGLGQVRDHHRHKHLVTLLSESLIGCSHLHIVAAVVHGLGKRPNNILQRIVALEYDKFRLTESLKKPVGVEGKR